MSEETGDRETRMAKDERMAAGKLQWPTRKPTAPLFPSRSVNRLHRKIHEENGNAMEKGIAVPHGWGCSGVLSRWRDGDWGDLSPLIGGRESLNPPEF